MNNAPKTSLRLITSALALAAGLAISTVTGAAVAMPATDYRIDLYAVPADFGLSTERPVDVVRAPVTILGGTPRRGDPADFGLSTGRPVDVVRAPVVKLGGTNPAAGGVWTGLAAGY